MVFISDDIFCFVLQIQKWWRHRIAHWWQNSCCSVWQSQDAVLLMFVLISILYFIVLPGNFLMIFIIRSDLRLTVFLCFFLGNLNLPRRLLLFNYCSQDADGSPLWEEDNLQKLHHSALFLSLSWCRRRVSSCCDGLWPLHSHMSSFT
jgi:hypothetical protein